MIVLETERLILRTFTQGDLEAMVCINQDPKVMKYFPAVLDRDQTFKLIQRIMIHQKEHDYSLHAVELKSTGEMIGFVGLLYRTREEFDAPFMPSTEIGWRLGFKHWGHGYATEAAKAMLCYGFVNLNLDEIVSFTVVNNKASRRVMEKIGMHHRSEDDFNHPALPKDSPLSRHVLYRLKKSEYFCH